MLRKFVSITTKGMVMNITYESTADYLSEDWGFERTRESYIEPINVAEHNCPVTALKIILNELYESYGAINTQLLLENFACLCQEFGVDDEALRYSLKIKRTGLRDDSLLNFAKEISNIYS